MVQTLLEISSLVVRNAVVDGRISNLSRLPVTLRRWLFKTFRMKRLLENDTVIRVFKQPGFFDEFTAICMHDDDEQSMAPYSRIAVFDGSFVEMLLTVFHTDLRLTENITELSIGFSVIFSLAIRHDETRPLFKDVAKLLAACKNLKRLQLVAEVLFLDETSDKPVEFQLSPEIMDVSLPALTHVSLIGCTNYFILQWLPRRWFESVQSLELRYVHGDLDTYVDILSACQHTLVCLTLKHVGERFDRETAHPYAIDQEVVCPLAIALPKLKSLWFESSVPNPTIFEKILEHCQNLTTAMVKMKLEEISESQLAAIAQLSARLQLDLICANRLPNLHKLVEIAGERIVGLSCYEFTVGDYDRILSRCRNLWKLVLNQTNDEVGHAILKGLFSDRERAAMLTHVVLSGVLSVTVLNCLFANLFNVQCLVLEHFAGYPATPLDISNGLRVWVENGARPVSITLYRIKIDLETFCLLLNTCGRSLRRVQVGTQLSEEQLNVSELNLAFNCCPFIAHFLKGQISFIGPKITPWHEIFERQCFNYEPYYGFSTDDFCWY